MNVISAASSAIACANIALIKYWGKRETARNLPAVGSISLTLEALRTETTVKFDPLLDKDSLAINQMAVPETQRLRVSRFLDLIRREAGHHTYASVTSTNNFPTGAGLASSASAFAALTLAAANAAGLTLTEKELSVLARQGSGSAARSVYGGIVEMKAGHDLTGDDDYAMQLADENYWDLKLLILITSVSPKGIGSTDAMNATAVTSAYYQKWVDTADQDLAEMRVAIEQKDFDKLGELAEYSA
ncbi:MAG: diphosphomevalonate decarboxylase, partial [Calditrichales bacterium]